MEDPSFAFDYAHILPLVEKCSILHGHTSSVTVELVGEMKNNLLMDFGEAKKIIKEYKEATSEEILVGIRDNFTFGFLGSILVVFIASKIDLAVLFGYLSYYSYMGKIVNRPKYVTDLGQLIVFPIPSALGAFTGYKLSYFLIDYISKL